MRRSVALALTVALVSGITVGLLAQGAPQEGAKPAGIVVEAVHASAVVKALDQKSRTVTLALPEGNAETFDVPPEVINFDQMKVGDKVEATYVASFAVDVHGSKAPPSADAGGTVALAPKGARPGAYLAKTRSITAKVTYIDHAKRLITLTGPKGNGLTFKVGPEAKRFDEVKQGDEVTVAYTESLLVRVVPEEGSGKPKEKK